MLSNKAYDVLNKIQRWLPALAAFYVGLSQIWAGIPYGDKVSETIMLVATLMAATLEVANYQYEKSFNR